MNIGKIHPVTDVVAKAVTPLAAVIGWKLVLFTNFYRKLTPIGRIKPNGEVQFFTRLKNLWFRRKALILLKKNRFLNW